MHTLSSMGVNGGHVATAHPLPFRRRFAGCDRRLQPCAPSGRHAPHIADPWQYEFTRTKSAWHYRPLTLSAQTLHTSTGGSPCHRPTSPPMPMRPQRPRSPTRTAESNSLTRRPSRAVVTPIPNWRPCRSRSAPGGPTTTRRCGSPCRTTCPPTRWRPV